MAGMDLPGDERTDSIAQMEMMRMLECKKGAVDGSIAAHRAKSAILLADECNKALSWIGG